MSGSEQTWLTPPDMLTLPANEVHVWLASLEQPEVILLQLQDTLSSDEQLRAAKFHFDRDRRHFIIARGILRTLLGRYLDTPAGQLQFAYNKYSKPLLDMSLPGKTLHFNLSHSHELALLAFSYVGAVGVDLEYMRPGVPAEDTARVSFSPREQALLLALPVEERREVFYTCWARKEAYIKGRGTGFSLEPSLFDVTFLPGEPAALLASREDPYEPARWTLQALQPGADYAGALAVEGHGWSLRCYEWLDLLINSPHAC